MAISHEFEYTKPVTVDEALAVLSKYGHKARILAGGTDLAVRLKEDIETPEMLVDIKGITELNKLEMRNNEMIIGAGITFSDLINSSLVKENFPLLWESSTTVASIGTRNRATLAGNICSAVPSLDSGPALLCYEAEVVVKNTSGERMIPISQWFTGPKKTDRKTDELVVAIKLKKLTTKHGACYVKLGRYRGEDLAQAGVGIVILEGNKYRIAFCALGPVAKRASQIEALLNNNLLSSALIEAAKKLVEKEISPITDIRASKEYRMHIAEVMIERGLIKAQERLNGEVMELTNILGG